MNIAGAKVENMSVNEVINQLEESIQKYLRIGE